MWIAVVVSLVIAGLMALPAVARAGISALPAD
jgi:hypothetical protein